MNYQAKRITSRISCGAFVNVTGLDVQSWTEQLKAIRRLDVRGHVEVWLEWLPESRKSASALKRVFEGERVIVHAPFVGLSLVSSWADLRELSIRRLEQAMETANALRAAVLTVHPGLAVITSEREEMLDRVADSYLRLQESAGRMTVALENMPDRRTATRDGVVAVKDFRDLLARNDRMKFTLDIGHAVQNSDRDFLGFISEHHGSIANIHLHDGIEGGAGHLALGEGELDMDTLADVLIGSGYSGFMSLETLGWVDTERSWNILQKY